MPCVDELHSRFRTAHDDAPGPERATALRRAVAQVTRQHPARPTLPEQINVLLTQVEQRHLEANDPNPGEHDRLNEAIWSHLERKHSDTISIVDAEDRLLRGALVLVMADDAQNDVSDTIGWAAEMLADGAWPRGLKYF